MHRTTRFLLPTVIVAFAGCASAPTPPAAVPFQSSDVAWSHAAGTSTVEGRAEVRGPGGRPHTCAGGEAQLVPASRYATRMMSTLFGNDRKGYVTIASSPHFPDSMPAEFRETVRRARCDADGNFRFEGVPAGGWFVFSNVIWRGHAADGPTEGGPLMLRVEVAPHATMRVALAP